MPGVIYNPTDRLGKEFQEEFRGHYMGVGFGIEPGQKVKFDNPGKVRHILNEFSPRGLVALEYGDEEKIDEIAEKGLERNRHFKVKQINDFNEKNSARKHRGLEYLWPTDTIKHYAKEIGVKLVESYQIDDAQLQKVKTLEDENKALKGQIGDLNVKFEKLMDMMSNQGAKVTEEMAPEAEEVPEQEEPVKKKENTLNVRDGPKNGVKANEHVP